MFNCWFCHHFLSKVGLPPQSPLLSVTTCLMEIINLWMCTLFSFWETKRFLFDISWLWSWLLHQLSMCTWSSHFYSPNSTLSICKQRLDSLEQSRFPHPPTPTRSSLQRLQLGTVETEGWGCWPATVLSIRITLLICFIYHFYISFPRRMDSKAKKQTKPKNSKLVV